MRYPCRPEIVECSIYHEGSSGALIYRWFYRLCIVYHSGFIWFYMVLYGFIWFYMVLYILIKKLGFQESQATVRWELKHVELWRCHVEALARGSAFLLLTAQSFSRTSCTASQWCEAAEDMDAATSSGVVQIDANDILWMVAKSCTTKRMVETL